jgi:hypothetical protein
LKGFRRGSRKREKFRHHLRQSALALDALRGLVILAMRLSGQMPFNPAGGIYLNGSSLA